MKNTIFIVRPSHAVWTCTAQQMFTLLRRFLNPQTDNHYFAALPGHYCALLVTWPACGWNQFEAKKKKFVNIIYIFPGSTFYNWTPFSNWWEDGCCCGACRMKSSQTTQYKAWGRLAKQNYENTAALPGESLQNSRKISKTSKPSQPNTNLWIMQPRNVKYVKFNTHQ